MKKKILSLFIIGCLFAGMGLSSECFAAPHNNNQHKEFKHNSAPKKPAKPAPKKQVKKAPAKKQQAIQKHRQANFKAKKQHQKEAKKFNKKQQKIDKKQQKVTKKTNNRHSLFGNHNRRTHRK